jgi:hypothetical protein
MREEQAIERIGRGGDRSGPQSGVSAR